MGELKWRQLAIESGKSEHLKMAQPEFATAVGVSKGAISQWETDITTPKGKNLIASVNVTGRSPSWFMNGEEPKGEITSEDSRSSPSELTMPQ